MPKLGIKIADVMEFVQSKQKIKPCSNFLRQLQVWEEVGFQVWENEDRTALKAPYKAFLEDRVALLQKKKEKNLTGKEKLAPQSFSRDGVLFDMYFRSCYYLGPRSYT